MGRPSKPWYWADRDQWNVRMGGKLVVLAKGKARKKEAMKAFHELMSTTGMGTRASSSISLAALADLFLDMAEREKSPATAKGYRDTAQMFVKGVGPMMPAASVLPLHVSQWLATKKISDTTRRNYMVVAKRIIAWGKAEGYLAEDKLAEMRPPWATRRKQIMTATEGQTIWEHTDNEGFRDYVIFMAETGCRPSEAARVEAGMVRGSTVVMQSKTSERTGKDRVIFLTDLALAVIQRNAEKFPEGPVFRNTRGAPWTQYATSQRFRAIRKKLGLGKEATAESYRHQYATDALQNGVQIATLAELMGHTSTTMISKTYSHLIDRQDHMAEALEKIRGKVKALSSEAASRQDEETPPES